MVRILRLFSHSSPKQFYKKGEHVVGLGGIGMQASLLRLNRYHPELFKQGRVHLIGKPNWILNIDDVMKNMHWGQPVDVLNSETFQIAQRLFPNLEPTEKMTFAQMRSILKAQDERLTELGVHRIQEEIKTLREDKKTGDLIVEFVSDTPSQTIPTKGNHLVFNAARKMRRPAGMSDEEAALIQSAEQLYIHPPTQAHQIAMFGSGRNTDWCVRDILKNTDKLQSVQTLVHVIPPGDRERGDLEQQVAEAGDGLAFKSVHFDEAVVGAKKGYLHIHGKDPAGDEVGFDVPIQYCYSATGTELDKSLTAHLNPEKVHLIDTQDASKYRMEGGVQAPVSKGDAPMRLSRQDTHLPFGNFTQTTSVISTVMELNRPQDRWAMMSVEQWLNDMSALFYNRGVFNDPSHPHVQSLIQDFQTQLSVTIIEQYKQFHHGKELKQERFLPLDTLNQLVLKVADKVFKSADKSAFDSSIARQVITEMVGKQGPQLLTV